MYIQTIFAEHPNDSLKLNNITGRRLASVSVTAARLYSCQRLRSQLLPCLI